MQVCGEPIGKIMFPGANGSQSHFGGVRPPVILPIPRQVGAHSLALTCANTVFNTKTLMDLGISKISQVANPDNVRAELESVGLFREYVPSPQFNRYRYQIDIDGNTNSWPGLLMKLLTGSPVLKVASPRDYRQWYYNQLVPWHNFVPVAADMSDLADKVQWLIANDDIGQRIGAAGRALGKSLDFAGELRRACPTITAALRRFGFERGSSDCGSN